ncbi:MAG: hypothetical protein WA966_15000 [Ornithinimicrobium sp.]
MVKSRAIANRERKAKRTTLLIKEALVAVGTWFDDEAECVEASALLTAVLDSLGVRARVQLVHTIAFYNPNDLSETQALFTSQGAVDYALAHGLGNPDWDWDSLREQADSGWAGHAVVIVEKPGWVLDPTFSQFTSKGFPDRVICQHIADPKRPEEGSWSTQPDEFDNRFLVHYIPEDGDTAMQGKAVTLTHSWHDVAGQFATHLLSGGSAANAPWRESWRKYKETDPVRDFS